MDDYLAQAEDDCPVPVTASVPGLGCRYQAAAAVCFHYPVVGEVVACFHYPAAGEVAVCFHDPAAGEVVVCFHDPAAGEAAACSHDLAAGEAVGDESAVVVDD